MTRLGAAIGGGAGALAGMYAGTYGRPFLPRVARPYAVGGGAVAGALVGAAIGAGSSGSPKQVGTGSLGALTPAQASGHPDFITDVATQGPTDQGLREADCRFMRTRIPTQPNCVDCEGPIPMWARQNLSVGGRANYSGIGERLSFGGVGMPGFSLAGPGDPDVFGGLSAAQQAWVRDTLVKLNDLIVRTTGTSCPTFGPSVTAAGGCFQGWFNGARLGLTKANGAPVVLRTDGVFDQDTLDALRTVAALHPADFPTPFPGTSLPGTTGTGEKKLSTVAKASIAAGALAVVGGIAYAVTHKKRTRRSRR